MESEIVHVYTREEVKKVTNSYRILRGVLTIEITLPFKKYSREQKRVLTTENVMCAFSEEYEFNEILKNDQLRNWPKKGYSQTGVWKFKVKKIGKNPTPKAAEIKIQQKEKQEQPIVIEEEKVEPEIEKTSPPEDETPPSPQKTTKKTSKNTSFRGRIKNIANKK